MIKFCGLTVSAFQTQAGLNGQSGELRLTLVKDVGDVMNFPTVGTPVYFEFASLNFTGLLQAWAESVSIDGNPTFTCVCTDPREVLESAPVILDGYAGASPVENIFNLYGYWENTFGFGSSGPEGGMYWGDIRQSLLLLANNPPSTYGGSINYRGIRYGLDLSEIPNPPEDYRITGTTTVLGLIDQVCQDVGVDYFLELSALKVKVRVIDRRTQPPLGTLRNIASNAAYSGIVPRSSAGVEARNDPTTVVLVGGFKTTVITTSTIYSYWGNDAAGNPIIGVPGAHADLPTEFCEFMTLNAGPVAEILGSMVYPTNTIEMRCALYGYNSWWAYISKYNPAVANILSGIFIAFPDAQVKNDVLDDRREAVLQAVNEDVIARSMRFYEFVHGYAHDFYGRQFLAAIPSVQVKLPDAADTRLVFSHEPAEAGFLPDGALEVGVSLLNQDVFQDPDERVLPFITIPNAVMLDTGRIDWSQNALERGAIYSRISLGSRLTFLPGPVACVRFTTTGAVYGLLALNGPNPVRGAILGNEAGVQNIENRPAWGTIGEASVYPPAAYPTLAGIPLKSNIETYGPWIKEGSPGKVRFEQDSGMVPWAFGGMDPLNLAAYARVNSAASEQTIVESGEITVAHLPICSPGQAILSGGPSCISVDCNYSTSGWTTTYRFSTFTAGYRGAFHRQAADRVRQLALANIQHKKVARRNLNKAVVLQNQMMMTARGFRLNAPKHIKKESPIDLLIGQAFEAPNGDVRVGVSTVTYEEALGLIGDEYSDTAISSWSSVIRPFGPGPNLAPYNFVSPTGFGGSNAPITSTTLFPFTTPHDTEVLSWGAEYTGLNAYARNPDGTGVRSFALRGPLVVEGWGRDTKGNAVPTGGPGRNSSDWKTGAVDMLWDDRRGVWTSHDLMTGKTTGSVSPSTSGTIRVGDDSGWTHPFYNNTNQSIPSGTSILVGYTLNENRWLPIPTGNPNKHVRLSARSGEIYTGVVVTTGPTGTWPDRSPSETITDIWRPTQPDPYPSGAARRPPHITLGTVVEVSPDPDTTGRWRMCHPAGSVHSVTQTILTGVSVTCTDGVLITTTSGGSAKITATDLTLEFS